MHLIWLPSVCHLKTYTKALTKFSSPEAFINSKAVSKSSKRLKIIFHAKGPISSLKCQEVFQQIIMTEERKQKVINLKQSMQYMQFKFGHSGPPMIKGYKRKVKHKLKKIIQTENVICQFFICSTKSQISLNRWEQRTHWPAFCWPILTLMIDLPCSMYI